MHRLNSIPTRGGLALNPILLVGIGLTFLAAPEPAMSASVRRDAVVRAVEQVKPSVVNIATATRIQRRGYFYDWWRDHWAPFSQELPPEYSAGSGVIVDEDGYVLTNVHVVEGADEIWVKVDGEEFRAEPIVGTRRTDVALLRLKAPAGKTFQAVTFADDDDLYLGETVLAMGNPFGLGGSVSRGILSAKNRRPIQEGTPMEMRDWLQTDAAINPGNSGGPLVNLEGKVIGINVAIYKEGQGIGFAIPIKRVRESLAAIYTPSPLQSLWFGAQVKPGETPLRIAEVHPGSPAARAGLQSGDQVVRINGQAPKSFIDFTNRLIEAGRNRPVSLVIRRGEQQQTVQVQLVPEGSMFNAGLIRQKIGVSVQPLTPELAEGLGLSRSGGLIISAVDRNSPAARSGLKQNHVIVGIDGNAIQDLTTAARMLYERSGEKVSLDVVVEERLGAFVRRQTIQVEVQVR